jgi:hypothetical protein
MRDESKNQRNGRSEPLEAAMIRFALILCSLAAHSVCSAAEDAHREKTTPEDPPMDAVLVSYARAGKPPLPTYKMKLTITNRHDRALWYVIPYFADVPLNESGEFACSRRDRYPIDVFEMHGDEGRIVAVGMSASDRTGFYAFRIPASGRIIWQNWITLSHRGAAKVQDLDVWEATDLIVNGTVKLEKWLPYDLLSSENVNVVREGGPFSSWAVDRRDLNWDREKGRPRTDLPTDVVKLVKVEGVNRWKVRLVEGPKAAP